jgi:ubiquitin fusion degradation protein 1
MPPLRYSTVFVTVCLLHLCFCLTFASQSKSSASLNKFVSQRWEKASELAQLEQRVEDYNAEYIATCSSTGQAVRHRRLICLPLNDGFDPPMGVFSHGHVQTGDKMSLPPNFLQAIVLNQAEVPWLFKVERIEGVTQPRVELTDNENDITPCKPLVEVDKVVGGPLDFRAPPCYVFLPLWMMRSLGVRPRDVVQVDMVETVSPGSLARLRPHSSQFAKDIANPQAVLETQLRHYSALVQGSTIAFDYNKKRYWFDVTELRSAPRGEKEGFVKVQDCDIATDFLPSRDTMKKRKRKQQQKEDDADDHE